MGRAERAKMGANSTRRSLQAYRETIATVTRARPADGHRLLPRHETCRRAAACAPKPGSSPPSGSSCWPWGQQRRLALFASGSASEPCSHSPFCRSASFSCSRAKRRFATGPPLSHVDGIIVLGGGQDPRASAFCGQVQLNDGPERYTGSTGRSRNMAENARLSVALPHSPLVRHGLSSPAPFSRGAHRCDPSNAPAGRATAAFEEASPGPCRSTSRH